MRFLVWLPSLFSSVVMYGLFIFWHGNVLNDFIRLHVDMKAFYVLSAIAYFVLGVGITFLHRLEFIRYNFPFWLRIILVGILTGVAAYALSVVLPFSVERTLHLRYILFDISWQILEQIVGSAVFCMTNRFLVGVFHNEWSE